MQDEQKTVAFKLDFEATHPVGQVTLKIFFDACRLKNSFFNEKNNQHFSFYSISGLLPTFHY
jgi:hypothetical protein